MYAYFITGKYIESYTCTPAQTNTHTDFRLDIM